MSEFKEIVQALKEIILNGGKTDKKDWTEVLKQLGGDADAEIINSIYDFVCENFSFKIENGAEGYVYFGGVNADGTLRAYQMINGIVDASSGA